MTISITLRLTGDDLIPQEITSLLGVDPTLSRAKGEIKISSTSKEIAAKTGLWTWKVSDFENDIGLLDQIELLWAKFRPAGAVLKRLPGVENAWIDLCVVRDPESQESASVELFLDEKSIGSLYSLGLPIEITVYAGA
jgi:hypothetical protein